MTVGKSVVDGVSCGVGSAECDAVGVNVAVAGLQAVPPLI